MVIFKSTLPSLVVACSVCGSKILPGSRLATYHEVKGSEQRARFLEKQEHFWNRWFGLLRIQVSAYIGIISSHEESVRESVTTQRAFWSLCLLECTAIAAHAFAFSLFVTCAGLLCNWNFFAWLLDTSVGTWIGLQLCKYLLPPLKEYTIYDNWRLATGKLMQFQQFPVSVTMQRDLRWQGWIRCRTQSRNLIGSEGVINAQLIDSCVYEIETRLSLTGSNCWCGGHMQLGQLSIKLSE